MGTATYRKRKDKGMCVVCGKYPARKGYTCCEACAEKQRLNSLATRKVYKSLGICARCGQHKLYGDEKTCPECLAKESEYRLKRFSARSEVLRKSD